MRLESTEIINRPVEEVYKLVRDDLAKLVPYMPNVEKIDVKKRSEKNGKVEIINHWYAKAEIPSLIKKFINPDLLSWKDYATWDDERYCVDFKLESTLGKDLYDCTGTNTFKAKGKGKTELKISCEIYIHADRVPGVPRILASKVLPAVEGLIEKILAPNLTSLGKGLNNYFDAN